MEYVNLGRTGLKVSRLCLGAMTYGSKQWREWVLEEEQSLPFFRRAIEAGINFFDTADVYSLGRSEEITGKALRQFGPARDRVVIATKVFSRMSDDPNDAGLSRKHILHSIDASLRRLGTDYVDLYQIHRFDPETPMEETLEALDEVVRAGKARYIGASSMYAWQFLKMLELSRQKGLARFVSMQNHYNLVYREEEREMLPLCRAEGVGVIPWSPLARGFLTGSRRRDANPHGGQGSPAEQSGTLRARTDAYAHGMYYQSSDYDVVDRVSELAARRAISNAQVALAWLLAQPGVTAPIIGASRLEHLDDAIRALEVKLTTDEMNLLEEPYQPHPVLGHS
jgi:aryl-alcohol dehydrogenase (NADP+)